MGELTRRLEEAEGTLKELHQILAEHLKEKIEMEPGEGDNGEKATKSEANPKADALKFFSATELQSLRVESSEEAAMLVQRAKAAHRKAEAAALDCGGYASANVKLREELKEEKASECLKQVRGAGGKR